jgi:chromosome segregation ATPase
MANKKLILKCRFGKHLPNGEVIELEKKVAEKLIKDGNAIEPPKGAVAVSGDAKKQLQELTNQVDSLTKTNEDLVAQNQGLTSQKEELATKVEDLTKQVEELSKAQ